MELKLRIRQSAQLNRQGQQVYYEGPNPSSLTTKIGSLPVGSSRRWRNYLQFIDVTNDCSDLHRLKLTWTTDRDDTGQSTPGQTNQKKSASGDISFEGEAFQLIKSWLLDDVSAALNTVDVQVEHVGCGIYENYQIKSTDLNWCATNICQFNTTIKQKDEPLTCIKRTMISDNWQGWFQTVPANGKKHPRFSYCNEQRPNGVMIMIWYVMNTFAGMFFTVMFPILLGYNAIVAIIQAIIWAVNQIPGVNLSTNLQIINGRDIFGPLGQFFTESAGCGREHPAPLIRDYITNVCDYCGVKVTAETAPVFFANQITIETSNSNRGNAGVITQWNPHYNACYFHAPNERGIRRFKSLMPAIPPFTTNDANTTDFYIPHNSPIKTLDMFLDELKAIYNFGWDVKTEIINGQNETKLYIQRKDWFREKPGQYVLDFTGDDKNKIIEGICFEWSGKKSPAYIDGIYTTDAADTCGNEARKHMNGVLSIGNIDDNPTLEGKLDKTQSFFGATKFRLDGASTDYIYDALQVVANGATLTPIPSYTYQLDQIAGFFEKYADYALLLKDETCVLPKILIWDGVDYMNAKCVKMYSADGSNSLGEPGVNTKYNTLNWSHPDKHPAKTFVLGSGANLGSFPPGYYTARTALGIAVITQQPAMLVNYPMFFEPGYYDTLWDWFHWIDDPKLNPVLNQNWSVKIPLCCEDLKKLKVFGDASKIKLGEKVKLPIKYYQDGKIIEITVSYDTSDELGQYIEIRGDV